MTIRHRPWLSAGIVFSRCTLSSIDISELYKYN
jgi:hypothetical protein